MAAHFARAFTSLGLTGAALSHEADTAWAFAGLTVLGGSRGGGTYAARVVAYRARGDKLPASSAARGPSRRRLARLLVNAPGKLRGAAFGAQLQKPDAV